MSSRFSLRFHIFLLHIFPFKCIFSMLWQNVNKRLQNKQENKSCWKLRLSCTLLDQVFSSITMDQDFYKKVIPGIGFQSPLLVWIKETWSQIFTRNQLKNLRLILLFLHHFFGVQASTREADKIISFLEEHRHYLFWSILM